MQKKTRSLTHSLFVALSFRRLRKVYWRKTVPILPSEYWLSLLHVPLPGPLLFIVYINDLDEKMTSTVLKFADDTKISSNSQQELQRDLDTAVEWAQTWQMQFNTNKCKVMHVGHRNERAIWAISRERLHLNASETCLE